MRTFHGPNLVILSRAAEPPVPRLRREDEKEEARDIAVSAGLDEPIGTKSEIRGISAKSSLNLSRTLSMLDWAKNGPCIHVSLTYGRCGYPGTKSALQSAKAQLVAYLGRRGFCGIWRLEFQSRESEAEREARYARKERRQRGQGGSLKVPHWHLLLWIGEQDPRDVEEWLCAWWAQFSGNSSSFGIKITRGDQARGAWYLAMHAAKAAQSPPFAVGRWWGYIDRDRVLGASDLHCHGAIDERVRVWWARLYRRCTGATTRSGSGLSWFLPRAYQTEVHAWILAQIDWERVGRLRPGEGGCPF